MDSAQSNMPDIPAEIDGLTSKDPEQNLHTKDDHDHDLVDPVQQAVNEKFSSQNNIDDDLIHKDTELKDDYNLNKRHETWRDKDEKLYVAVYKAALMGDWTAAERIIDQDPSALHAKISGLEETLLHVAVSTGHSCQFVQKLVELIPVEVLHLTNANGDTPLHYAAIAGNTEAAKILVQKNPKLTMQVNIFGLRAVHDAARYGHRDTVWFLLSETMILQDSSQHDIKLGVRLLILLIVADFYDIALHLLKRYPVLALEQDDSSGSGTTALGSLASKPKAFTSAKRPGRFNRLLRQYFADRNNEGSQGKNLMYMDLIELLKLLISQALEADASQTRQLLKRPIQVAASKGIPEIVIEIIRAYPESIWFVDDFGRNIFHLAVFHRQEKVYNLLYHMSSLKHFVMTSMDWQHNNILHTAARLTESQSKSGAALQMQSEWQWFKEVEKVVQPLYREMYNVNGMTPRYMFHQEHRELVREGETWMKETATSCTVVAALVITVVFAAAFTVPGGNNNDKGIPIYLKKTSFMIFAVSDALAFFSSSTSLLMFLCVFTSRYTEEDFFRSLTQLSIGLVSLFFSIVSMVASFSAALYIVLFHEVEWIAAPICLLACIPVSLFAYFQFPLWLEIASSTFGPSIFGKRKEEILL